MIRSIPRAPICTTWEAARIAISGCAPMTSTRASASNCRWPPTAAPSYWRCAAATSCWVTRISSTPRTLPGVGLVDIETVRASGPRLIGNAAIEVELDPGRRQVLAGFENHGGRTALGAGAAPLGRVLNGHGNDGHSGYEGVRRDNVIGTYLHGPLLPKNAWFADWLIETALGLELGLTPLDDRFEDAAHAEARRAAGV